MEWGYNMKYLEKDTLLGSNDAPYIEHLTYGAYALRTFFHSMHHAASGPSFVGQHQLYKDIYEKFDEQFDALVERCIGTYEIKNVKSPLMILDKSARILYNLFNEYEIKDPVIDQIKFDEEEYFKNVNIQKESIGNYDFGKIALKYEYETNIDKSIIMLTVHLIEIKECYYTMKSNNQLTLGVDDLLMNQFSDIEVFLYKLKQMSSKDRL
jgi:DNA-binding ferritin-like protein